MKGKNLGVVLVLLMPAVGVATLLIGYYTWIFVPDFPYLGFLMFGAVVIGFVLTNFFVELVPWEKTREILL